MDLFEIPDRRGAALAWPLARAGFAAEAASKPTLHMVFILIDDKEIDL